jgi:hypothetical protein
MLAVHDGKPSRSRIRDIGAARRRGQTAGAGRCENSSETGRKSTLEGLQCRLATSLALR